MAPLEIDENIQLAFWVDCHRSLMLTPEIRNQLFEEFLMLPIFCKVFFKLWTLQL